MTFPKVVYIGRIAYIANGKNSGELAAVLDVVDYHRVVIDGPLVSRRVAKLRDLRLTEFKINIQHTAAHKAVVAAWDKEDIDGGWAESTRAKKLDRQKKKASMTDFDRFKLMKAIQARNKLVNLEFGKLRRLKDKKYVGDQ